MDTKQELCQWEAAAAEYRRVQESSAFSAQNRALVEHRFSGIGAGRVLDAGCGYGQYTGWFAQQGARVTGCDGARAMLELAQERYPGCRFDLADLTGALPYLDGAFDLVFCNQVLMDLPQIDHTLEEFARVLRPGGRLWFSIVHPAFYLGEWVTDAEGRKWAKEISGYLTEQEKTGNFWGKSTHYHRPLSFYLNLCAKAGFSLTELTEPPAYDPGENTADLPLFLCAEFVKAGQGQRP